MKLLNEKFKRSDLGHETGSPRPSRKRVVRHLVVAVCRHPHRCRVGIILYVIGTEQLSLIIIRGTISHTALSLTLVKSAILTAIPKHRQAADTQ